MIDTKIRIKEKTNSYMCKVKITKESLEDYKTPEGMGEFKKDILEAFSAELDSYITDMIEIEDGIGMSRIVSISNQVHTAVWKVNQIYYIRCKDLDNNQPDPNTCSVILKPTKLDDKRTIISL